MKGKELMSRTTKILSAIVAVLAGVYAIQKFTTKTSTTQTSRPFADLDTSKVTALNVNFGEDIRLQKVAGSWNVVSPILFPADPGQMSMVLTRLASNPSASIVADNLSDSSAYGLGGGAGSVSVSTSSGKSMTFRIGNATPDLNGTYISMEGEPEVFQLATNLRPLFGRSLTGWRDKRIFNIPVSDIASLDLALGDTLFHFTRNDTSWNVNGVSIPSVKAEGLAGDIVGAMATGFVDSTLSPSKVMLDYGITLLSREHLTGQIFKSAESEFSFGEMCISNSANNQIYTIAPTFPEYLVRELLAIKKAYLSRESS